MNHCSNLCILCKLLLNNLQLCLQDKLNIWLAPTFHLEKWVSLIKYINNDISGKKVNILWNDTNEPTIY